jgi:tight adherence protein B
MLIAQQTPLDLIIAGAVFGLVLMVWLMGVLIWLSRRASRSRQLEDRLGLGLPETAETRVLRLWKEGREATTTVAVLGPLSLMGRLAQLCREAGWSTPPRTVLLGLFGSATLLFLLAYSLSDNVWAGLAVSISALVVFWVYLKSVISRRLVLFESQFVEAMELAARSLRAGHPLIGAFRLITEEMAPPVSTVFSEICQLQGLGMPLERAILKGAADSGSGDMKLFATSVVIQMRSGGNLADMMDRVAFVIRDRMRVKRRVRVLTAQTTLSRRVLTVLPVVMFIFLNLLNPQYMAPLYSTDAGRTLLLLALGGLVLGTYVMKRLTVLRY